MPWNFDYIFLFKEALFCLFGPLTGGAQGLFSHGWEVQEQHNYYLTVEEGEVAEGKGVSVGLVAPPTPPRTHTAIWLISRNRLYILRYTVGVPASILLAAPQSSACISLPPHSWVRIMFDPLMLNTEHSTWQVEVPILS